jgi:hypothetical protein
MADIKPKNSDAPEEPTTPAAEPTESEQKAAEAKAKADTSAAVPSGGAGKVTSKPKQKPNPKSAIPMGTVYYIDEEDNLVKDGSAKGLSPEEVLNTYLNSIDEEEQDAAVAQVFYAARVNGKIEYFELSEKREFVLTPVEPEGIN